MMKEQSTEQIHEAVRRRYGQLADQAAISNKATTCCDDESDCCADENQLYTVDLSQLPDEVTDLSLGCGDPIALASLQPGEIVLDLGSGGGIDCFLAAQRVGQDGFVFGVDMTPSMIERARTNAEKVGYKNVEFRLGKIEALPLEDDLVDIIISNCVINLSPDKPAVFQEAYRVLKPGGRLAVSDMVTQGHFSPSERADMNAWAGCITGAEDIADYVAAIREAGFVNISVRDQNAPQVELADAIGLYTGPPRLFSARVTAVKTG